jgi:site-specific DNA-methyltransferase (adenine-specific)
MARTKSKANAPATLSAPIEVAATWEPIESLVPWVKNPRLNDESVDAVAASIQRFGFGAPVVARRENREIIAGHTRVKAALKLGHTSVPVRFLDISEEEAHALALADNKLAELADWNTDVLSEVLRDFEANAVNFDNLGWDATELSELLMRGNRPPTNGASDPGPGPLPPDAGTHSKLGTVYQLGPHRLVCGDSSLPETWALLDAERGDRQYDLKWSDPPYGVKYSSIGRTKQHEKIANDDMKDDDLLAFLRKVFAHTYARTRPGGVWYIAAPGGPLHHVFSSALVELPTMYRQGLVWLKDVMVFGRSDRHYQHEAIFYGWKEGAAHTWTAGRKKTSVLEVPRPKKSADHPTMKPLELIEECISCHRPEHGDVLVVEPFCGSGSTLIASARQGYVCHAVELSPAYCDVIRDRWTRWATEAGQDPGPGKLLLQRE